MAESCSVEIVELSDQKKQEICELPGSSASSCNSPLGPTSCIYMVDKRIRNQKPDAYTPDTVSIGPYHRDKENPQMKAMETLKSRYVEALLVRAGIAREKYKEAIRELKPDPRESYFDPINLPKEEDLLEVMLVDGLFIIELFRKYAKVGGVGVGADDPIFYSNLKRTRIIRDLALLENQIPMSVLEALFDLSKNLESDKLSLIQLALHFFDVLIPEAMHKYPYSKKKKHKHLLDLLIFTLEAPLPPLKNRLSTSTPETIPCVTELRHSGVLFKSRCVYGSLLDLKFHKNGKLEIPPIHISDYTDPFFRNLIAYEQHHHEGRHCITSYAILMDYLINTAADVVVLRDCGIISNHVGDDDKVASLFNNLCCEIFTGNFIYGSLCNDVRAYYKFFWNEWKASLQRDFCNSPWTIIPVVAAVILLLLTIWSALFAAFPVFNVTFKH